MNKRIILKVMPCLVIVISTMACTTMAEEDSEQGILQGVYTVEQAERGATTFRNVCRACHVARDFRTILQQSENTEALIGDYYDLISMTMPQDSPGGLSEETYLDVMAYLLSLNGYSPSSD